MAVRSPRQRTVRIGWRHAVPVPDPGAPPRRPAPADRTDAARASTRRGSEAATDRPLKAALCGLGAVAALALGLWPLRVLPGLLAFAAVLACLAVAAPIVVALLQSRAVAAERAARERERLAERRRADEEDLRRRQEEHAEEYRRWRVRRRAFEAQPRWYAFEPPAGVRAVVVVGGTDAGWSALLTGLGAARLADGGGLSVVDLSGRAVAGDLVALARHCGARARVRVLPADLPRLTLGTGLEAGERARTLAAVAAAADPKSDAERDRGLLEDVLGVLGAAAGTDAVLAALRAVAAPDDDAHDDPSLELLDAERRAAVRAACGTDRATADRAWELERHLAPFEGVGSRAEDEPPAQVSVLATDRAAGEVAARAYGAYAVAGLCRLLERGEGGAPWSSGAVAVCGADAVPAAELDRLEEAAARAGAGLVLVFPEAGDEAMARVDGPGRMPVVMRQPGPRPAARLAEWFGEVPEVRLHRLSEVIGEALSGSVADGYAEQEDPARAATVPTAVRAPAPVAPLDLVRHLRAASAWGRATAQAAPVDVDGDPRPLRADVHGLRSLPPTAMLVPGEGGAVLADANPGILTLATATLATVEEGLLGGAVPVEGGGGPTDDGDPPANLGPPPERLDWRGEADGAR
ncbi:hypothetical protein [Nocardiopsis suaedae]|uniref:TraD/TraG TraM recognition site domain-containing protein n=1 Tax=Nocardiopsis suaedae TaxID=3018444 RepID=A0ABT4TQQ1_9ACTN|nr:hypothetical protein [Nocardiopsis suaedae]MDA2807013.1 hypothetical protein [Nocardiopsis suaedae]